MTDVSHCINGSETNGRDAFNGDGHFDGSKNGQDKGDSQELNGKYTHCITNGDHPAPIVSSKKIESLINGAPKAGAALLTDGVSSKSGAALMTDGASTKSGAALMPDGASLKSGAALTTHGASSKISDFDGFLFDPSILRNIPWSQESQAKFKGGISVHSPGEDLAIRPLHIDDYHKGFLSILAMLTSVGSVSEAKFLQRFEMMRKCPNSYYVTVIEDKKKGEVIGCATLQVEFKFIHDAGVRGRVEDVVVNDAYRGRQLGKLLLETLTILGREYVGCYKMSLECKDSLIDFYGQFGFNKDAGNNYLQQRFLD